MPKLAALFSPERAADVIDPETRRLLEDRFDVVWATADHTTGPGSLAKPPALDPAAVPLLAEGADVLLTSWGTPHLDKELWADGNGPKVVAHAAGTVKNLIDPVILDQGVGVFSAGPRIAWSVGEYCLASMLTLARRLPRFDGAVRGGGWKQTEYRGHELAGAKVGIIGASSTARALITLLKPFGCDVVVYDPYLSAERAAELGVRLAELPETSESTFLTIHVPNVPETKGMISRELIERLPDGAVVVNSSRGPAIDQQALLEHAVSGRIYAALDVYDPEPPVLAESALRAENLLLTPHIAGDTAEGHLELAGYVLKDALQWLEDGTRGPSFVDPALWSIAA